MPSDRDTGFDLDRLITDTFVAQVQFHETIDSTNTAALAASDQDDLQLPLLVLTGQQTAGRGRGSNTWWSAPGSLTFSLLLNPSNLGIMQQDWPRISLTTGLATCLALEEFLGDHSCFLKWPNDVFVNDRKVSGILIENQVRGGQISSAIVGIGINVNELEFGELRATSLNAETGSSFDREDVLQSLSRHLEAQYLLLRSKSMQILENYQASLYGKDEIRNYIFPDGEDQGVLQRVAIDGSATFARNSGKHSYTIDHVKWCWED